MSEFRDSTPAKPLVRMLERTLLACQHAADASQALTRHAVQIMRLLDEEPAGKVHVLATGKASVPMLRATLAMIPFARLGTVRITCPPEHAHEAAAACAPFRENARVFACDHPLPTARNVQAAEATRAWAGALATDDTLLVLLSGGASAHLCLPAGEITLDDLAACTRGLQRAGATIHELNAVRKHAELLKGGQLARACTAHRLICVILSDVLPRNHGAAALDVIASGPTVPDPTTYADALAVLRTHGLHAVAARLTRHLEAGARGEHPETPKSRDQWATRTDELIVGDNSMMLAAAAESLRREGVHVVSVEHGAVGDGAATALRLIAQRSRDTQGERTGQPARKSVRAALIGGEWTVNTGASTGSGGPSQELALAGLLALPTRGPAALLAYSSDGADGPTPAAGAIVSSDMLAAMDRMRLEQALANHDSHHALRELGAIITTGPTGTNVNHIAALLWEADDDR